MLAAVSKPQAVKIINDYEKDKEEV